MVFSIWPINNITEEEGFYIGIELAEADPKLKGHCVVLVVMRIEFSKQIVRQSFSLFFRSEYIWNSIYSGY